MRQGERYDVPERLSAAKGRVDAELGETDGQLLPFGQVEGAHVRDEALGLMGCRGAMQEGRGRLSHEQHALALDIARGN